jgi:VWFA-related protein
MRRSVLGLFLVSVLIPSPDGLRAGEARDPERWRPWLEEVSPLITAREREAFLGLADEAARKAFVQRFWQVRDPFPATPRNELEENWQGRLGEVRRRWGSIADDRSRVYLLQGDPSSIVEARCAGKTYEVWTYEPRFRNKQRSVIVFASDGGGPVRLWRPQPGGPSLGASIQSCAEGARLKEAALWIGMLGQGGYESIVDKAIAGPKPKEWVSSFAPVSVEVPEGTEAAKVDFQVSYPGREGDRSVARVLLFLPPEALATGGGSRELLLAGQVLRGDEGDETVETFRYRFDLSKAPAGAPLAFERPLPAGPLTLRVKLEGPAARTLLVGERGIDVPSSPAAAPAVSPEVARLFAEADASLSAPDPSLRLLVPSDRLLAGHVRFEARVDGAPGAEGERIERVAFALDGKPLLTRTRAPYEVMIDLGEVPRVRKLVAEGLNARGEVLARDEAILNAVGQRFVVRLAEPRPGRTYRSSLRARAVVEAPEDRGIERVEFYLGDARVATLYQPPFTQPITLPNGGEPGYVRAVAYLTDGTAAEDLVLLNTPDRPDELTVNLVELYATVADSGGRLTPGLAPGDFRVFEDGVRQEVRRVEPVTDTPVRVVALIDNSASMRPSLEKVRQAALGFLRRTLRPEDRAAVITFNRTPRVAVGLTGDLTVLEEGLTGLYAEEETSLYDSLIFSLYYLAGVKGQRAVLLLSDGMDRTSDFSFEAALECARRAGIAVYAIGLDLSDGPKGEAAGKLAKLAAETGGRSFFVAGTGALDGVYQTIERELRAQYRIAYQSSNTERDERFRAVRVEVGKPGLEARTISGYYP